MGLLYYKQSAYIVYTLMRRSHLSRYPNRRRHNYRGFTVASYLAENVKYKPARPSPAVIASQERAQGQHEAPGYIHHHPMQLNIGELEGGASLIRVCLPIPFQTPHVQTEDRAERSGKDIDYMLNTYHSKDHP